MVRSNKSSNKLRCYTQQPQRFSSQALETSQLDFRKLNEPHLAWLLQPSPEPVEPDLAMHHGFLEPSPEYSPEPCWTWPGSAPRPSPEPSSEPCWTWPGFAPKLPRPSPNLLRTFSEPSPNLLWNLLRNPVGPGSAPKPPKPSPEPSPEPCWTWPGFAPKLPRPSPNLLWNLLRNPVGPGSAPKPPKPSPDPSPEPCWTWPGPAPKPPDLLRNLLHTRAILSVDIAVVHLTKLSILCRIIIFDPLDPSKIKDI